MDYNENEFILNIFVRLKKNGKFRVILNLKYLNDFVEYYYFKMEMLLFVINLVLKNCYFVLIDL